MVANDIDDYLASVEEPKRSTLEALRRSILDVVPDAEQCISYGMPAFKVRGKTVAGFAAFKDHLSYLPHSGSVLAEVSDDLAGYRSTKGSLHFAVDRPLPDRLVRRLVETRMRELGLP
ncbi:MAG: iron chaperone [Actinomycetes bacterium]